jgi:GxxExxY protein
MNEQCLAHELCLRGLQFERQHPLSVVYKGVRLGCGYRLIVLRDLLLVELKATPRLLPVHQAQVLTHL